MINTALFFCARSSVRCLKLSGRSFGWPSSAVSGFMPSEADPPGATANAGRERDGGSGGGPGIGGAPRVLVLG